VSADGSLSDGTVSAGTRSVVRDFGGGPRPGLAEWLHPPANRWAFRHARELFWSERVGLGTTASLAQAGTDLVPDPAFASYLERSHTDALVVLVDGEFAREWYRPGVQPDDRHILFSVTKSVVGLVASALIAQGDLDDGVPVADYLPEVLVGGYASATVRQLLDMTVNVRFDEDYEGPDFIRYRKASGQIPSPDPEGIHAFAATVPSAGSNGHSMIYASPTADLAGWVCERATGRSLAELIRVHVWGPMGAEFEGDLLLDRYGAARASGGYCAAARDMARIGQLLLSFDDAVADVGVAGDRQAWANGPMADFLPNSAYRSLWYQPGVQPGLYLAAGIYGQRIYVDTVRRVVIAQQSSLPTAFDPRTWSETMPLFDDVARTIAQV
jgi:CubicO group peptidase (beta-lactamase class C family)